MYILEGNMGVGKTTLLTMLSRIYPHITIHLEPHEDWTDSPFGKSLLEHYFADPARWEFTTETYIMARRVKDHLDVQSRAHRNIIMERSVYAGHFCYAYLAKAAGYYSPLEWKLYNEWTSFLLKECVPPQGFIYLQASPQTCYTRVKKRARTSEKNAPFSFIQSLHHWLEQYLIDRSNNFENIKYIPVLVLDANSDFCQNRHIFEKHARAIDTFMLQTQSLPEAEHTTFGRQYK